MNITSILYTMQSEISLIVSAACYMLIADLILNESRL